MLRNSLPVCEIRYFCNRLLGFSGRVYSISPFFNKSRTPADDYIQGRLSLDEHLIQHKDSTFFVRAKGNSMIGAGIFDGDLLVVDKSLEPQSGDIVIAVMDDELTVKRLIRQGDTVILRPENPRFKDIELKDGQELQVWGVVTSTIKKFIWGGYAGRTGRLQ